MFFRKESEMVKTLIEAFAAEQEIACEKLERIKLIIRQADRAKSLVMLEDSEADEIREICDAVQSHLRDR